MTHSEKSVPTLHLHLEPSQWPWHLGSTLHQPLPFNDEWTVVTYCDPHGGSEDDRDSAQTEEGGECMEDDEFEDDCEED